MSYLLKSMREIGYGDRRRATKIMEDIPEAAAPHTKREGIDRRALAWKRIFSRLKSH